MAEKEKAFYVLDAERKDYGTGRQTYHLSLIELTDTESHFIRKKMAEIEASGKLEADYWKLMEDEMRASSEPAEKRAKRVSAFVERAKEKMPGQDQAFFAKLEQELQKDPENMARLIMKLITDAKASASDKRRAIAETVEPYHKPTHEAFSSAEVKKGAVVAKEKDRLLGLTAIEKAPVQKVEPAHSASASGKVALR